MNTKTAINLFGSPSALAKALGVTAGAVSQWIAKGTIPPMRVYQLQVLKPDAFESADTQKAA